MDVGRWQMVVYNVHTSHTTDIKNFCELMERECTSAMQIFHEKCGLQGLPNTIGHLYDSKKRP